MLYRLILLAAFLGLGPAFAQDDDLPFRDRVNPADGLIYIFIPPGEFWMGCVPADTDCHDGEKPRHRVTLTKGYWIGQTEVTVGAFRRFVEQTGHRASSTETDKGRMYLVTRNEDGSRWLWIKGLGWQTPIRASQKAADDWPVVQVSWRDADTYCRWAGGRLPTSAQWERAARGGREGEIHPWGNAPTPQVGGVLHANGPSAETKRMFPTMQTFDGYSDGYAILAPVAQFAPNPYGLYDMAGNVYEWVNDWFDLDFYERSPATDPTGPRKGESDEGDNKVMRGGAWNYYPSHHRNSFVGTLGGEDDFWTSSLGFRCVLAGGA